ncbi:MAG: hypothetical protein ACYDHO_02515 [Gaiellaceae bacterium]
MIDEKKTARESELAQEADDRSYEAPEVSTIGSVGELTSANESSIPK